MCRPSAPDDFLFVPIALGLLQPGCVASGSPVLKYWFARLPGRPDSRSFRWEAQPFWTRLPSRGHALMRRGIPDREAIPFEQMKRAA
ncbi:MAG: hypothetical protein OXI87_11970, partial [Albidovulum sp.]|nr:hypothetical protein [Albidovulum sp.]